MKRAIGDLASFTDDRLFREVSEGVPLIVENAISLDETAHRLYREKEFRASEIIRGFAEEEAAKVLILIDLVRCPQIPQRRVETLKRFYGHVAKRIYAMTCSYPKIASFGELCELVEMECRPYYLDGPNWVDWIFPNSISAEREQTIYVDYVQDITDEPGDYHWRAPTVPPLDPWPYETPDCVRLSRALLEAGANMPDGLAEIANIWRGFEPGPETDRGELRDLIAYTLDRLAKRVRSAADESVSSFIVSSWSFPLWPLTMKEPRRISSCPPTHTSRVCSGNSPMRNVPRCSRWDGMPEKPWLTGRGFTKVQSNARQRLMRGIRSAREAIGLPVWIAGRKSPDHSSPDGGTARNGSGYRDAPGLQVIL